MKKITVITVCYNAAKELPKTLESVLQQNCSEYEYVIIDGASTDSTLKILEEYKHKFELKSIDVKIVSERDNGIYNAMNKGIRLAKGEWLYFLNAGDALYNQNVLQSVLPFLDSRYDVVYGNTIKELYGLQKTQYPKPLECVCEEMPFCHQSVFTRRDLMLPEGYDESYKICADHEFYLDAYLNERRFHYIDVIISIFQMDGISSVNEIKVYDEIIKILQSNGDLFLNNIKNIEKHKARANKNKLRNYVPHKLYRVIIMVKLYLTGWRK